MESMDSIVKNSNKGKINEMKELTVQLENTEITTEDEKHKEVTRSGMKELALKSNMFYEDKIKLFL